MPISLPCSRQKRDRKWGTWGATSGLDGAAGILPGAGKGLSLGSPGQKKVTLPVIDPDADHQAVFSALPGSATPMYPAGQVPVLVIYVVKLHLSPSLSALVFS